MTVSDFIKEHYKYAYAAYKKTGLRPEFSLAQAALESGWGEKFPANNMFGIKSTGKSYGGWDGTETITGTMEDYGSGQQPVKAGFRAYKSKRDSFIDYAGLIKNRYPKALTSQNDYSIFASEIKKGGYATAADYAPILTNILNKIATNAEFKEQTAKYKKKATMFLIGGVTLFIAAGITAYILIKNKTI